MKSGSPDAVSLAYDQLPPEARIAITTAGGWPKEISTVAYAAVPALVSASAVKAPAPAELPESLKKPFLVLSAMGKRIASEPDADYERAFVSAALSSCRRPMSP